MFRARTHAAVAAAEVFPTRAAEDEDDARRRSPPPLRPALRLLSAEGGQRDALNRRAAPDLRPALAGLALDWRAVERVSCQFLGAAGAYETREDRMARRAKLLREASVALKALAADQARYTVSGDDTMSEMAAKVVDRARERIEQDLGSGTDPLSRRIAQADVNAYALALYDLIAPRASRPERKRHYKWPQTQLYNETAMTIAAAILGHYYGRTFDAAMVKSRLQAARNPAP